MSSFSNFTLPLLGTLRKNPETGNDAPESYGLTDPQAVFSSGGRAMYSSGEAAPQFSTASDTASYAPYIGAGVQAASTAAGVISQAAQAQAQRDFLTGQSQLDRDTRAALMKMQLGEQAREANQTASAGAYRNMLSALSNQMQNTDATFNSKRASNGSIDELLSSAFLHRR